MGRVPPEADLSKDTIAEAVRAAGVGAAFLAGLNEIDLIKVRAELNRQGAHLAESPITAPARGARADLAASVDSSTR
jgi:hypothetical protein